MANEILTAEAVVKAVELYQSLPAATILRGLTVYGLVVDHDNHEVIGEVPKAKGIWKPMYFMVVGGEKTGRRTLTAERISAAVQQFQDSPLFAVLRSTTGRGLRLDSAGMVELVDIDEATTQVTFELTHYGGRSIVPALVIELGTLTVGNINWQGGFGYNSSGNKPAKAGEPLILTRFLIPEDYALEEALQRVWEDVVKEVNRLTLLYTDGTLPAIKEDPNGRIRAFLTQELTKLVAGIMLHEQPGFGYRIRGDQVVEVQKSLHRCDVVDEAAFATAFDEFRQECSRVLTLYCQELSENQRRHLGTPAEKVFGLATTPKLTWQEAREGGAIAFHPDAPRKQNAVFPDDGWNPSVGDTHRVLCVRKGRGFTGYPAPPVYIERFAEKEGDPQIAARQLIRVGFDGIEKVMTETEVLLEEKRELRTGNYWSPKAKIVDRVWTIVETLTDYDCLIRQQVVDTFDKDVNGKSITKIDWRTVEQVPVPHERSFPTSRVWLERAGDSWGRQDDLENLDPSNIWKGWVIKVSGVNPEGKEVETTVRGEGGKGLRWEEVPKDLQDKHLADWPVCACGRVRYEAAKYDKCSKCRNYRECARCGELTHFGEKTIAQAEADGEPLYCHHCQKWVEAIQMLSCLQSNHREQVAAEAQSLLSGEITEGEEAAQTVFVEVINRRFENDWDRSSKLKTVRGHRTAVVNDNGYWATQFTQGQLQRLATLLEHQDDTAVVSVAMLVQPSRADTLSGSEFKRGYQGWTPQLSQAEVEALVGKVNQGEPVLAVLVAESEKVVEEAEQVIETAEKALDELAEKLGVEVEAIPSQDGPAQLAEARKALEKADYAEAKKFAQEALVAIQIATAYEDERQARAAAGEIWLDVVVDISGRSRVTTHVYAIAEDGSLVEPVAEVRGGKCDRDLLGLRFGDLPTSVLVIKHTDDNYGYQYTEVWEICNLPQTITEAQRQTVQTIEEDPDLHRYFMGAGTGWDLSQEGERIFATPYHRDFYGEDQEALDEMRAAFPVDVVRYETEVTQPETTDWDPQPTPVTLVGPHLRRSPEEKAIMEALRQVEGEIQYLAGSQEAYEEDLTRAQEELAYQENDALDGRFSTLRQYFVIADVVFSRETYKGQFQMQGGVRLKVHCEECGKDHQKYVKLVANPHETQPPAGIPVTGRLSSRRLYSHCNTEAWWFNPILPPLDTNGELAELQNRKVRLEKELAAQAAKVDAFDEEGNPQTAMAAAFSKARAKKVS